jgi:ribonucleoside-diphosphate reductase alpha chain
MREVAQAAWECADPGMQYDTTINEWHTCPASGRINASNPCSEYMHLDNSACNLASLNLMRFVDVDGNFDVAAFRHAVEIVFTAQEIVVGNADYPTESIGRNTKAFRQLGLGYANLGALLMARGLPYDSDGGRASWGAPWCPPSEVLCALAPWVIRLAIAGRNWVSEWIPTKGLVVPPSST